MALYATGRHGGRQERAQRARGPCRRDEPPGPLGTRRHPRQVANSEQSMASMRPSRRACVLSAGTWPTGTSSSSGPAAELRCSHSVSRAAVCRGSAVVCRGSGCRRSRHSFVGRRVASQPGRRLSSARRSVRMDRSRLRGSPPSARSPQTHGRPRVAAGLPLEHPPPDDGRPLERDEQEAVHQKPQKPDDPGLGGASEPLRRRLPHAGDPRRPLDGARLHWRDPHRAPASRVALGVDAARGRGRRLRPRRECETARPRNALETTLAKPGGLADGRAVRRSSPSGVE
jgi:hypothetical protein